MSDKLVLIGYDEPITLKGVVHGDEILEEMLEKEPKRKSPEFKVWRKNYNTVVNLVNKIAGFQRYSVKR